MVEEAGRRGSQGNERRKERFETCEEIRVGDKHALPILKVLSNRLRSQHQPVSSIEDLEVPISHYWGQPSLASRYDFQIWRLKGRDLVSAKDRYRLGLRVRASAAR